MAWCGAATIACGTAAFGAHLLLRPAPARVAALSPATIGAEPQQAAPLPASSVPLSAFEPVPAIALPLTEPPAALADVLLGESMPERPRSASSSVLMFSSFSPLAAAALTGSGSFREEEPAAEAPSAPSRGFREVVRPPPRPAFIEARLKPEPGVPGIVEARIASSGPAWSEASAAAPSFWGWPGGGQEPAEAPPGKLGRALQSGMASWYGPGFHGRRTASGEIFNQNALTAAHPRLPFGTKVRVVDERTGRSIVVRINDRGPYAHGRVIDLSKASAAALGMGGLARVKIVSAE